MRVIVLALVLVAAVASADEREDYVQQACGLGLIPAYREELSKHRNKEFEQKLNELLTERNACLNNARRDYDARLRAYQERQRREKEEDRRAEETRRRIDEAAAAVDAQIDKLSQDATEMRVAYSTQLCTYRRERQDTLREIARQKKYARIGGVENLSDLYALQQTIREIDEKISGLVSDMIQKRFKPLPCSSSKVAALLACMTTDDDCSDDMKLRQQLVSRLSQ